MSLSDAVRQPSIHPKSLKPQASVSIHPPPEEERAESVKVRYSSLPTRISRPPEGKKDERSIAPPKEGFRRNFQIIAELLHRYSTPQADLDIASVTHFLKEETEELNNSDPLVALLTLLRKEKVSKNERKIGAYRIVEPAIKKLNDEYLGQTYADNFIADLHKKVAEILAPSKFNILNRNYKGGTFVIAAKEDEEIARKLDDIQRSATYLLIEDLQDRQQELSEVESVSEEENKKRAEDIKKIGDFIAKIYSGEETVKIAFGIDSLPQGGAKEGYAALQNAQMAANLHAYQLQNTPEEEAENLPALSHYSETDILNEIVKAQTKVKKEVLDKDGTLKKEWEEFFILKEGKIYMQPSAIENYRKREKFEKSEEYAALGDKGQKQFEFFCDYCKSLNILDVVKSWTYENRDHYFEKVQEIANLVEEVENTKGEGADEEKLRKVAQKVLKEVEISLKDQGREIVGNTRAQVKALMEEGEKLLIFGDHVGFGIANMQDYEKTAHQLVDMLELNADDAQSGDKKIIETKLAAVQTNEARQAEWERVMHSIGDEGTKILRETEKELSDVFGEDIVFNGNGGDEIVAIIKGKMAKNKQFVKEILEVFSDKKRLTIIPTNLKFTPIPLEDGPPQYMPEPGRDPVRIRQQTVREQLVQYLKAMVRSEEEFSRMKAENDNNVTILETAA